MLSQTTSRPLPAIFIGKDLIVKRIKRYLQNKHPLLSQDLSKDGTPREETRSIWYSREHVATWLEEMDHYQADGIRVYFGAYGDNEEGRPPGQLCLLMVPTRQGDNNMIHNDIILEEEPDFAQRQQSGTQPRTRGLGDDLLTTKPRTREYNYGSPCPPVCPTPSALSAD